jgi:peptide subunit release factor 1 (eRF1)
MHVDPHISLYVPPTKPVSEAIDYLKMEWETAVNIKDKETQRYTQYLLAECVHILSKEMPKEFYRGFVLFAKIEHSKGPQKLRYNIAMEDYPPSPLLPQSFIYIYDDHFHKEYLSPEVKPNQV